MKEAVGSGKTVEDAIQVALSELNVSRENVDITVLDLPSRGLLGIFPGKNARVQVREVFDPVLFASDWLEQLLDKMDVRARVDVDHDDDRINVNISGQNLGPLIGRKGQTLDALQYLTTLAVNKKTEQFIPTLVDVGDYRKNRQLTIERASLSAYKRVQRTGRRVVLNPMNAAERRLVHMVLGDKDDIVTYSIGEEPRRKVVVDKKKA